MAKHLQQHELYAFLSGELQRVAVPAPIPDTQPSENGDCGLCGEQLLDTDPDGFTEFHDGDKRVVAHGQCGIDSGLEMA